MFSRAFEYQNEVVGSSGKGVSVLEVLCSNLCGCILGEIFLFLFC